MARRTDDLWLYFHDGPRCRVELGPCLRCEDRARVRLLALLASSSSFSSIPNGDQLIVTEDSKFLGAISGTSPSICRKGKRLFIPPPLSPPIPQHSFSLSPSPSPQSFLLRDVLFPMHVRFHAFKRHVARDVQPEVDSSPDSASSPVTSSKAPLPHLSTSARSLIGSFIVVGAILFGLCAFTGSNLAEIDASVAIVAWKLYSIRKRRKARALAVRAAKFSIAYGASEKSSFVSFADKGVVDGSYKVVLPPRIPSDPNVRWVPQIRSVTLPSGVTVPPIAVTAPERTPKLQDGHPPTPNSGPSLSPVPSPPPAYRILGLHSVPVPPIPPASPPTEIPPPTPMHRSPTTTVSTPTRESFDLPPIPCPSPRSASFQSVASTSSSTPRTGLATIFTPKSLPRLMQVTASFQPSRPDELGLRVGETLRLIKEFEDEWCLVQRVGPPDAEKGVVPRFCLTERPRIIKTRATLSGLTFNGARRK